MFGKSMLNSAELAEIVHSSLFNIHYSLNLKNAVGLSERQPHGGVFIQLILSTEFNNEIFDELRADYIDNFSENCCKNG